MAANKIIPFCLMTANKFGCHAKNTPIMRENEVRGCLICSKDYREGLHQTENRPASTLPMWHLEYIWDKNQTVDQYLKSVDKELTVLDFKRFTLRAE